MEHRNINSRNDEILGSHGQEYEDDCLLEYYSVLEIYRRFRDIYCLHHQDEKVS
jgi:hypothetical protein